jgi:hypothetical protein
MIRVRPLGVPVKRAVDVLCFECHRPQCPDCYVCHGVTA